MTFFEEKKITLDFWERKTWGQKKSKEFKDVMKGTLWCVSQKSFQKTQPNIELSPFLSESVLTFETSIEAKRRQTLRAGLRNVRGNFHGHLSWQFHRRGGFPDR